jgi:hypothetical protein
MTFRLLPTAFFFYCLFFYRLLIIPGIQRELERHQEEDV